jgi:hypothetical protein
MEYRLDLTTLSCEMPYLDTTDFAKLTYQSSDKGATKILSSRDSRSTGTSKCAKCGMKFKNEAELMDHNHTAHLA